MRRFYFLMIFMLVFILHQNPQKVQALEEETRIPAGVSLSRFKLISQPEFSEAYNHSREFILSGKAFSHLEKIRNV